MLIRSQDKKSLAPIEVDGVLIEEFIEKDGHLYDTKHKDTTNETIVYWITGSGKWLGEYSTEAKAIKVLDMIETRYHDIEMSKIPDYDTGWVPFTFQMPSDEEVEG